MISFPTTPDIGDVYTYANRSWMWNGYGWQSSNFKPDGAIVADMAPANPEAGWMWWDRLGQRLFVYNGSAWVEQNDSFPVGDLDVWDYVLRVQGADGQALETPVIGAIGNFIMGCKEDGIWDAIKSSCIFGGARTLEGALMPLKGTAPTLTNHNFVATDYDRKTGLKGNGTSKYLDTNTLTNTLPFDSMHVFTRSTEQWTPLNYRCNIGDSSNTFVFQAGTSTATYVRLNSTNPYIQYYGGQNLGALGATRNGSIVTSLFETANASISYTYPPLTPINPPAASSIRVFRGASSYWSDARLSFFSIGENIDLVKLNNRVTALTADFNTLIP